MSVRAMLLFRNKYSEIPDKNRNMADERERERERERETDLKQTTTEGRKTDGKC